MKWISVKDELPELFQGIYGGNQSAWIFAWNDKHKCAFIATYYGDDKTWRDGYIPEQMGDCTSEVTHWMEIKKP